MLTKISQFFHLGHTKISLYGLNRIWFPSNEIEVDIDFLHHNLGPNHLLAGRHFIYRFMLNRFSSCVHLEGLICSNNFKLMYRCGFCVKCVTMGYSEYILNSQGSECRPQIPISASIHFVLVTVTGWYRIKCPMHSGYFIIYCASSSQLESFLVHSTEPSVCSTDT
jgi:hypothetical protein